MIYSSIPVAQTVDQGQSHVFDSLGMHELIKCNLSHFG